MPDGSQTDIQVDSGDTEKRYIRTFQSDMDAVKRGEHPELAAFNEAPSFISEVKGAPKNTGSIERSKEPPPQIPIAPMGKSIAPTTAAAPTPPPQKAKPIDIPFVPKPKPVPPPPTPVPTPKTVAQTPAPAPVAKSEPVPEPELPKLIPKPAKPIDIPFIAKPKPVPPTPQPTPVPAPATEVVPPPKPVTPPTPKPEPAAFKPVHTEIETFQKDLERASKAAATTPAPTPPLRPKPIDIPPPPAPNEAEILARLRAKREQKRQEVEAHLAPGFEEKPQPAAPLPEVPVVSATEEPSFTATPQERLVGGSSLPPIAPPPPPPRATAPPRLNPNEVPAPLHTFVSDFSDRLKDTKAGTAAVLAAQEDAAPISEDVPQPTPRSRWINYAYAGAGVVLLIGAGVSVYALSSYLRAHPSVVAPTQTIQTPIFVDDRMQVSGAGTDLLSSMESAIAAPLSTNSIRALYTGTGTSTETNLFSEIGFPAPSILLRNINDAGSMAGVISDANGQSLFFILSVTGYSDSFAGMLSWEPRMMQNLALLFPPYPAVVVPITPVATTTNTSTTKGKTATTPTQTSPKVPLTAPAGFRDVVIDNHDTRVYYDAQGRELLVYGYWNPTTLVIARNSDAFTEILERFASSKTQN